VRVASGGRKHFPLPVGAPLTEFAAIASQYPVYRIELPAARSTHAPGVQSIAMTSSPVDPSTTLTTILLAGLMKLGAPPLVAKALAQLCGYLTTFVAVDSVLLRRAARDCPAIN